jgi:hypothetical protein
MVEFSFEIRRNKAAIRTLRGGCVEDKVCTALFTASGHLNAAGLVVVTAHLADTRVWTVYSSRIWYLIVAKPPDIYSHNCDIIVFKGLFLTALIDEFLQLGRIVFSHFVPHVIKKFRIS